MTKAERIFQATRIACKEHYKDWGIEYNPDGSAVGFARLIMNDDEFSCTRTINAVQKMLDKAKKSLKLDKHFGIDTKEKEIILDMVESTINNERKALEELKAY